MSGNKEHPNYGAMREGGSLWAGPKWPSELAPSEPPAPQGSLRCDGVVGPLSREEVLILKIAEHVLHRDFVLGAVRKLVDGVRKAGTSQYQCLILRADLEELCQRADASEEIKWPNGRDEGRAETALPPKP